MSQIFETAFYLSQEKFWGKRFAWKFFKFWKRFPSLIKNLQEFWQKISDRVFKTALYMSGGGQLQLKKLFEELFLFKYFQTLGERLFDIWQKFSWMAVGIQFCVTGVSFSGKFSWKKNCLPVVRFGRIISKMLVKNFQQVCQNRNLRVSGIISVEKICWFWQPDFFASFLVF